MEANYVLTASQHPPDKATPETTSKDNYDAYVAEVLSTYVSRLRRSRRLSTLFRTCEMSKNEAGDFNHYVHQFLTELPIVNPPLSPTQVNVLLNKLFVVHLHHSLFLTLAQQPDYKHACDTFTLYQLIDWARKFVTQVAGTTSHGPVHPEYRTRDHNYNRRNNQTDSAPYKKTKGDETNWCKLGRKHLVDPRQADTKHLFNAQDCKDWKRVVERAKEKKRERDELADKNVNKTPRTDYLSAYPKTSNFSKNDLSPAPNKTLITSLSTISLENPIDTHSNSDGWIEGFLTVNNKDTIVFKLDTGASHSVFLITENDEERHQDALGKFHRGLTNTLITMANGSQISPSGFFEKLQFTAKNVNTTAERILVLPVQQQRVFSLIVGRDLLEPLGIPNTGNPVIPCKRTRKFENANLPNQSPIPPSANQWPPELEPSGTAKQWEPLIRENQSIPKTQKWRKLFPS